jgi:Protein kinase domain
MDTIGGYLLLGRISENRPVSVWKGRDSARERDVALTQVELTTDDVIVRLRAQARLLTGVSHPSIVELLELVEEHQHAWLVEAWIDAVPLSVVLTEGGPLSAPQAVAIVDNVLAGLAHAHDRAIVHGNLSRSAVVIDATGAAKLKDFGPCAIVDSAAPDLALSPEARSGSPITPRSDVYAMGALLAGLLPPESPAEIDQVVRIALAVDPEDRYRNAGEFSLALSAASALSFGGQWPDTADVRSRVHETLSVLEAPTSELTGHTEGYAANRAAELGAAARSALAPVQVRSAERPARSAIDDEADVRKYLESRSVRGSKADRNAGRFIPLAAMIVVVAAIAVLVITHHDASPEVSPGLDFHGSYLAKITVLSTDAGGRPGAAAGSVRTENWQVSPTCTTATTCTATVLPAGAARFTLTYADGSWTGGRAVSAAAPCMIATFVLTAPVEGGADKELIGSMIAESGACASPQIETGSVVLARAK